MPTPTPAKPVISSPRVASLVALAAAIGVIAYALRPGSTESDVRAQGAARIAEPRPEGAAERAAAMEPTVLERTKTEPSAGVTQERKAPSIDDLEAELAAHPDQVLRRLADALPRGEREAQRLTVLEIRALVARGEIGSARTKARGYFERWPGGPDMAVLEQLTGAHPTADRPAP